MTSHPRVRLSRAPLSAFNLPLLLAATLPALTLVAQGEPELRTLPAATPATSTAAARNAIMEKLKTEIADYEVSFSGRYKDLQEAFKKASEEKNVKARVAAYEALTIKLWDMARVILGAESTKQDLRLAFSQYKADEEESLQDIRVTLSEYDRQMQDEDTKMHESDQTTLRLADALKGYKAQIAAGDAKDPAIKDLIAQFRQSLTMKQRIRSRRAILEQYRRRFERRAQQKQARLAKAEGMIPTVEKRMSNAGAYRTDFLYLVEFIRRNVSLEKSESSGESLAEEMRRFLKTGGKIQEELMQLGDLTRDFVDEAGTVDFPDPMQENEEPADTGDVDVLGELQRLWAAQETARPPSATTGVKPAGPESTKKKEGK